MLYLTGYLIMALLTYATVLFIFHVFFYLDRGNEHETDTRD